MKQIIYIIMLAPLLACSQQVGEIRFKPFVEVKDTVITEYKSEWRYDWVYEEWGGIGVGRKRYGFFTDSIGQYEARIYRTYIKIMVNDTIRKKIIDEKIEPLN